MREQTNFVEECKTLPDEELRKIYRKLTKQQKNRSSFPVFLLLPATIFYGFEGWLGTTVFMGSVGNIVINSVLNYIDFILFAAAGVLYTSKNIRTIKLMPLFFTIAAAIKIIIFGAFFVGFPIMLAYIIIVSCQLNSIVGKLNFLRGLPNFPFEARQKDMQFNGMSRDKMLDYLEREANGGVKTVDYDEIFTSENPEEIANPKRDTDDDFQQYKVRYANDSNYTRKGFNDWSDR